MKISLDCTYENIKETVLADWRKLQVALNASCKVVTNADHT